MALPPAAAANPPSIPADQALDFQSKSKKIAARAEWRFALLSILGVVAFAVLLTTLIAWAIGLERAVAEGGPVEHIQAFIWLVPALLALGGALFSRDSDLRDILFMLGGMGLAAGLRELDVQDLFNPEVLGDNWGVHYKLRWWFSLDAHTALPRLVWLTIFLIIARTTIHVLWHALPVIWKRQPWLKLLLLATIIGAALGWVVDDLLRIFVQNGQLPQTAAQAAEESCEIIAAAMFFLIVARCWLLERRKRPQ